METYWTKNIYWYVMNKRKMYFCLWMKKVQKQGMIQVIPAHSVTETNKRLKTDKISLIFLITALYSLQIM